MIIFDTPRMKSTDELIINLQNLLQEKQQANPSYSLRAMARDIGIPQPILSLFLSKKRQLSPYLAYKIGQYFKMEEMQIYYLILSTFKNRKL